jgi:hypothetical protein
VNENDSSAVVVKGVKEGPAVETLMGCGSIPALEFLWKIW